MDRVDFMDKVFDILNESEELELADINTDGVEKAIHVTLADGTKFDLEVTKAETAV